MSLFFLPPLRTLCSCILPCASEVGGISRPRNGGPCVYSYICIGFCFFKNSIRCPLLLLTRSVCCCPFYIMLQIVQYCIQFSPIVFCDSEPFKGEGICESVLLRPLISGLLFSSFHSPRRLGGGGFCCLLCCCHTAPSCIS